MRIMSLFTALLGMLSCTSGARFANLDVEAFAEKAADPAVFLVDVRTPDEYAEGHLRGAANIDAEAADFLDKMEAACPKETPVAIYCRSGRRSAEAAKKLSKAGYTVCDLQGGILAWQEAGKPVTKYAVETFMTDNGLPVRITLIKHGTLEIVCKGLSIHIDPVSGLSIPTDYATEFPKADLILVTHEHGDHFDQAAIAQLSAGDTRLITNLRCTERLRTDDGASGTRLGYVEVMGNGDTMTLSDDITVEAVPAYNITEGHTQFHPKGRDNGFILTIDGLRIYIAGDTEDIPEMADIKDIDIAFMPCNQPYTMTPEQLIKAAKTVKPKVLFPYHYGQTDVSSIPSELKGCGIDVRIRHYE